MKISTISILSCLVISSCAGMRPYRNIRVLHLTDDFTSKSDMGYLKGKDCGYSLGKYSAGQPKYERAFNELIKRKGGLSYVEDLQFYDDEDSISDSKGKELASKKCIIVQAKGYK